ncbi:hypothetical protein CIK05_04505 [Bdellovibrio sp. qaytius]|nr:hypothetical protein CIK05_04505 [Bdellovibrio sp. qaytius]
MKIFFIISTLIISGCGLKVINPNDVNKNEGTKALDISSGQLKVVDTFSCNIVAGNGKRVSAVAKTEKEARDEALAKCKDQTLISICRPENLKCVKN